MRLPLALSLPHAGLRLPAEVAGYCRLTPQQIELDGDQFAAAIYDLSQLVDQWVSTDVPRAIVDVNRSPDDRSPDGVIKSQTIWQEPVYRRPLPAELILELLDRFHTPYHDRLSQWAKTAVRLAIDCHTMLDRAPPIGPNPGSPRPEICLGNLHGRSCPAAVTGALQAALTDRFAGFRVALNQPFAGGYITRRHSAEMPWVQLEISRALFLNPSEIRQRLVDALEIACRHLDWLD